ncbi:MAG: radical SAM protein [archaeon]
MSKLKTNMPSVEFIIPPWSFLNDQTRNPPLGLLYVAAATRERGYDTKITDLRGYEKEEFPNMIKGADVYGITATTPDYIIARDIARIIKSREKESCVILGGVHASTTSSEKIDSVFDKIIMREGEESFLEALRDFDDGIDKRVYESNRIENLDKIPFPARDLLPKESAFSKNAFAINNGDYAATIITSRGCPFKCSFCASNRIWGRSVRFRSVGNVVDEIKQVQNVYGINDYRFHDDTMTLNKGRLEKMCKEFTKLGIKWRAGTRVDRADYETLKMMNDAGCEEMSFGVESLDQKVLDKNAKGTKLEQVYEAIKTSKKVGLDTRLFFIIGLPGEQLGFSDRLEKFLCETEPDAVDVSTLVPFPGSDISSNPKHYGISLNGEALDKYWMTVGLSPDEENLPPVFNHDVMSHEEILDERRKSIKILKERKIVKNF